MIITPIRCTCIVCENARARLQQKHVERVAEDLIKVGQMRASRHPLEAMSAMREFDIDPMTQQALPVIDSLFVIPRADA